MGLPARLVSFSVVLGSAATALALARPSRPVIAAPPPGAVGPAEVRVVRVCDANAARPLAREESVLVPGASTLAALGGTQRAGFPVTLQGDAVYPPLRGLVFADLDGDGVLEILVQSPAGFLHALRADGTSCPGFPVGVPGVAQTAPAIADLDGDGEPEIVLCLRAKTVGAGGAVLAIDRHGAVVPGFPRLLADSAEGSPALADLDADGLPEIVVAERGNQQGFLHVFEGDGTEWGGAWPVVLDHVPTATAAIADADGDGAPEIAALSYTSAYLLHADGSVLPHWPVKPALVSFSFQSPAFADLDGDGLLDLALGAHGTNAGVYVYRPSGFLLGVWPRLYGTPSYCPPTLADVDGDGKPDVVGAREGTIFGTSGIVYAWSGVGVTLQGFPYAQPAGGGAGGPVICADVDGDGVNELFADSNLTVGGVGYMHGVSASGQPLAGFPLRPTGFTYMNGAAVADVDGDGLPELGVLSFHDAAIDVNLYPLAGVWSAARAPWPAYHENVARTGRAGDGATLRIEGSLAPGAAFKIVLLGPPGAPATLWLGAQPALLATGFGFFRLGFAPFPLALFGGLVMPPEGIIEIPGLAPNVPAWSGLDAYLQGYTGAGFTNLLWLALP